MSPLLEFERELAGVCSLPEMADNVILDRLRQILGASGSTLFHFDHRGTLAVRGGSLEEPLRGYTPDLFREDPVQRWNLDLPASTFLADGTGFDIAVHVKSRPYADFYRPRGIGLLCGVWPTGRPFGSTQMFGFLFSTPTVAHPFAPTGKEQLKQLEKPLRSAARRIMRFSALEDKCSVLVHLLEQQRGSRVLWNAEGQLIWVSAAAQLLLHGSVPGSDLEHAAAAAFRQLRRVDTSSSQALLGRPQRLRSAQGAPLLVEFSWLPAADRRPWLLAEVRDCSGAAAQLSALTRAELRVLRLLIQGLSDREIGQSLAVSTTTVKTHVKHILSKLGVASRSKAASVARDAWDVGGALASRVTPQPR